MRTRALQIVVFSVVAAAAEEGPLDCAPELVLEGAEAHGAEAGIDGHYFLETWRQAFKDYARYKRTDNDSLCVDIYQPEPKLWQLRYCDDNASGGGPTAFYAEGQITVSNSTNLCLPPRTTMNMRFENAKYMDSTYEGNFTITTSSICSECREVMNGDDAGTYNLVSNLAAVCSNKTDGCLYERNNEQYCFEDNGLYETKLECPSSTL